MSTQRAVPEPTQPTDREDYQETEDPGKFFIYNDAATIHPYPALVYLQNIWCWGVTCGM